MFNNKIHAIMKKQILKNENVNRIYLLTYTTSYGIKIHTCFCTKQRAKLHAKLLPILGSKNISINEVNLWME